MRYYIIAGEPSGDMHAANLMKRLKVKDEDAYFRVWGGDRMAVEAQELAKHIRETSFMGIFTVVRNLRTIKRNFKFCEEDILAFEPDVLILIDNSGFNLRIAKFIKSSSLKTRIFYYILPQSWAWKQKRVHTIHQWCDRLFAILPFEKAFYRSFGYDVDYVGHPILDALQQSRRLLMANGEFREKFKIGKKPVIALLPGSRKREIRTKLPKMLKMVQYFPEYQFVIAGSDAIGEEFYHNWMGGHSKLVFGHTYDLLNIAEAALVTSGTATLETALFGVPQVVCYKPGWLTFEILKRVTKIKFICMVNLILDRMAVVELIEGDLNEERMKKELSLLFEAENRKAILSAYKEVDIKLGGVGASERAAQLMIEDLRS